MDVYHDKNIWGKGTPETKLTPLPVNRSFIWDKQEILIPAVYVSKAGAALDVCAKLDTDDPGSREFAVEICLDDTPLLRRMSSSMRWYPNNIIQMGNAVPASEDRFENNKFSEEWIDAYGCDRECCWYFERLCYDWNGEPILSPQKISLAFRANLISITAGHFSTGVSCDGETIKVTHPITGQEYILTLHRCEQTRHSFAEIGMKGMVYPEYCQILSYSITPEIDRSLFSIRDCAESDRPRMDDIKRQPDGSDGPTAVFIAGKNAVPEKRSAVSSLHFEPVPEVQWQVIFQVKPKDDVETSFPIET